MANDSAVRNQKVFITLQAVVALTTEYNRVNEEWNRHRQEKPNTFNPWAQRKQTLEYTIKTLDLPINI